MCEKCCCRKINITTFQAISTVVGNNTCVENIADSSVLPFLLSVLHTLPKGHAVAIEILENLSSNTKIIKQIMAQGYSSNYFICLVVCFNYL